MKRTLKHQSALIITVAAFGALECFFSSAGESQQRVAVLSSYTSPVQSWQPAPRELRLHMMAVLGLRNTGELERLKEQLQRPDSPSYHRWLSRAEFAYQFGPTAAQLREVTNWLNAHDFTVNSADLGTREVRFSGSVAQAEQAFGATIVRDGAKFANLGIPQVPADLAGAIVAIFGLNNLRSNPKPLPKETGIISPLAPVPGSNKLHFSPQDFWLFYNEPPPTNSGVNGGTLAPDCIALLENATLPAVPSAASSPTPSVVDIFTSQFKIPPAKVTIVATDPNVQPQQPTDNEPPLDVDWAHSVAPNTPIRIYVATIPNSLSPAFDTLSLAVSQNVCGVISSSIDDERESCPELAQIQAYAQTYAQAVVQGQTLFHSSGDYGSFYPCGQPGSAPGETGVQPSVEESSASPDVTVVGGTQFNPVYNAAGNNTSVLAPGFEQVWQEYTPLNPVPTPLPAPEKGTSGGGMSVVFPAPPWQADIVPYRLSQPLTMRGVPDVAAGASPDQPGYWIATTNVISNCPDDATTCFIGDGGTSASSPIWAGISRLIAQNLDTTRLGNINPQLYNLAARASSPLIDVSQLGDNCTFDTCSAYPGYQVGPGYDLGTGLGSPNIQNLIAAFQQSPGARASASSVTVDGQFGQSVFGGTLSITNISNSSETISTLKLTLSKQSLFSSLTMTASVTGGATEVSNTRNPDQVVVFAFNPPLGVSAGGTVQFTLKATLSHNTARTDIPVRFASLLDMDPLGRTLPIGVALWLLGIGLLAVPGGLRQRVLLLAALMTLLACTQIGCGNDNSGLTVLGSSEQQVQAGGVVTTNAHGTVSVEGLPITLSTIRLIS